MSFPGFASPGALANNLSVLVSTRSSSFQRRIDTLLPNCTILEEGTDELATTEQPVEQGAAITDHAYKRPAILTMRVAWSNSSIESGGDPNYATDIYNKLLALQVSGSVFQVVTGKRLYPSMLMISCRQHTDEETELALFMDLQFRQISIVQTSSTSVPPVQSQEIPQQTAPVQNLGPKQLAPAVVSTLGH